MYKLLCEYKRGNNKALEKIIENFKPLILKEASKYKIKCYDYEDLVQHGYLSVIKACNKYKGNGENFIPYCINAIKNNYKALLKGEIKHHREIPDEFILNKAEDYMFTLEDEVIAYEKIKELYKALDKLSSTTSKSYNEVRYAKYRAIKNLQRILKKHI